MPPKRKDRVPNAMRPPLSRGTEPAIGAQFRRDEIRSTPAVNSRDAKTQVTSRSQHVENLLKLLTVNIGSLELESIPESQLVRKNPENNLLLHCSKLFRLHATTSKLLVVACRNIVERLRWKCNLSNPKQSSTLTETSINGVPAAVKPIVKKSVPP